MQPPLSQKCIRIGTRRSKLAKVQAQWVADRLLQVHQNLKIKLVEVVTTGDKVLDTNLSLLPGKGVFVKEIEDQLLARKIDLAVHSMKDLPTEFPKGLTIGAVTTRLDPRDVLITRLNRNLEDLPQGAKIGTGSPRRKSQLFNCRSDLKVIDIRGNIDTRLRKAETPDFDGIILAAAGLIRMGWQEQIQQYFNYDVMIPAVGQGALGIEARTNDEEILKLIEALNDSSTEITVNAERAFLAGMGGGCQMPLGAYCREERGQLIMQAFFATPDGKKLEVEEVRGDMDSAIRLATELVSRFKKNFNMTGTA